MTQAVDEDNPTLGFFVRWITEFAKYADHLEVICLYKGRYTLPTNVRVHSLGKENGRRSALVYAIKFKMLAWELRNDYDAVFVHMNPEYVAIAGILWRILGKKIALWYTHKSVTLWLRVAALLADIIFTASKESFRLKSSRVRVMGHGIDTELFSPDLSVPRMGHYLSVGRLMPSKDHRTAIAEARNDGKRLRIVGEGPERDELEAYARSLGAQVGFLAGLSQAKLRDEYRKAALLIHTSKTGSLDKVVLEALACGLPVRTHDPALKPLENEGWQYVEANHSLEKLIPAIMNALS